jgi:cytochrome d ubiquinol oxidase subunit II
MMNLFSTLQLLSWLAVGAIMFLLVAIMGFDMGGGMLARFVGKTDLEKRAIINVIAPTWDGNQVWFITLGGAIFAIFPRVYAASFSGLYLGILVVLWGLFCRPVAFEYRSKLVSTKWKNFWDWMLFFGSSVPMLVAGVAIGNTFLGFPFSFDPGTLRFFYGAQGINGMEPAFMSLLLLLRPFALFIGVFAIVMSLMHGAAYCAWRTDGVLHERFIKIRKICALLFIVLFALIGVWLTMIPGYTWTPASSWTSLSDAVNSPLTGATVTMIQGGWLHNYVMYPWMFLAPLLSFIGAFLVVFLKKAGPSFWASVLACFGAVFTVGLTLFPFLMPSSLIPDQSLVVWNSSSSQTSLMGILLAAVIILPIIFIYTTYVYKKLWGRDVRMNAEEVQRREHELY